MTVDMNKLTDQSTKHTALITHSHETDIRHLELYLADYLALILRKTSTFLILLKGSTLYLYTSLFAMKGSN